MQTKDKPVRNADEIAEKPTAYEKKLSAELVAWRIFGVIAVAVAAALFGMLYLAKQGILFQPEAEETPAPVALSVTCYVPDGSTIVLDAEEEGAAVSLPEGPEIAGYTFLGWADAQGHLEERSEIRVYENLAYSARYAIAFRDESGSGRHEAYLTLDSTQFFRPKDALTRGEAVRILYALLDTSAVGSGRFKDVDASSPCYTAAATLKDLGVLSGSRLHPDEAITYGDFFRLLSAFFPKCTELYAFPNVAENDEAYAAFCLAYDRGWLRDGTVSAYDELDRREAVHIFNMLCGRKGTVHTDYAEIGAIADVALSDPDFPDIAEAVVSHDCTVEGDAEHWSASTPLPLLKPGFFFLGTELHCIGAEGLPLINDSYNGFAFDENGVFTSGSSELDALVRAKLKELVDPATMKSEEMLKILYDYVTYKLSYLRGDVYPFGLTDWEVNDATRMLSTGKGNCYSFAAAFWALSRAIGYDTVCYSGIVDTQRHPHGWAEIVIDGTPYIFDPTMENEERYITYKFGNYYMRTYESVSNWSYTRAS